MLRRTCREAWRRLDHPVLHGQNVLRTAVADRHLPLARWALWAAPEGSTLSRREARLLGRLGALDVLDGVPDRLLLGAVQSLLKEGHADVVDELLDTGRIPLPVEVDDLGNLARWLQLPLARRLCPDRLQWLRFMPSVAASADFAFFCWVWGPPDSDHQSVTWFVHEVVEAAAAGGSLHILDWLRLRRGHDSLVHAWLGAIQCPSVGPIAYLRGHEVPMEASRWQVSAYMGVAASRGHLTVLRRLHKLAFPLLDRVVFSAAGRSGNLQLVRWLLTLGPDESLCDSLVVAAAGSTSPKTFAWWIETGRPWPADECAEAAAEACVLPTVRLIHVQSGVLHPATADLAARAGNLDLLHYGQVHGAPLTRAGIHAMIWGNEVATLAAVIDRGWYPLDEVPTVMVRQYGSTEMADVLTERGLAGVTYSRRRYTVIPN
jgi:hypothetical protein